MSTRGIYYAGQYWQALSTTKDGFVGVRRVHVRGNYFWIVETWSASDVYQRTTVMETPEEDLARIKFIAVAKGEAP